MSDKLEAVERAIKQLGMWEDETPLYAGDDPRADYYRQKRETIRLAIAALQSTAPAQPTADAVERALRAAKERAVKVYGIDWRNLEEISRFELFAERLPTMSGDYVMVPNLLSAFRTTVSDDGKYEIVFRFKSMEAMHAADDEWRWLRNEKMGQNPRPVLETEKLVKNFTDALRAKLAKAETKYGYNDEWLTDDWEAVCKSELARHVAKGDPLDVAAYAAFCWARGWTTAPSPELAESQEEQRSGSGHPHCV